MKSPTRGYREAIRQTVIKKGEIVITTRLLDGRYELCDTIYESASTAVYLARHATLAQERIIKRIRKGTAFSGMREASILTSLRHPGIPILYDCEEDDVYIWLVEEYVRGMSLSDYLAAHESLTMDEICTDLVQICRIIEYLHGREPFPILYQDLKPEHLYWRDRQMVLIDYGTALYASQSGDGYSPFGTRGYAAPELIAHGTTNVATDLYSIGCIAELLLSHCGEAVSHRVRRLAASGCAPNPADRPETVATYRQAWEREGKRFAVGGQKHPFREIAVAGAAHACGTTHVAVSLVVYLNATGCKAYYADDSDSATVQRMCRESTGFTERDMTVYHHHFRAVSTVGETVEPPQAPEGVRVSDVGTQVHRARDCDLLLYVAGSRPWQERGLDMPQVGKPAAVIVNPANRYAGRQYAKRTGEAVFGFPLDEDPFYLSRNKRKLFERMLATCGKPQRDCTRSGHEE